MIYKFRRRFAKLLIAFGLIYIGVAISAVGQNPPQSSTQQFTTIPASNTIRLNDTASGSQTDTSVLAQNIASGPSEAPAEFIPQCTYRVIPYQTVYKSASWLTTGQNITTGGINGEEKSCTNQIGPPTVTTIVDPLDKTVTIGTYTPQDYNYPGYINSDGNYIPSTTTTGDIINGYIPTAICGDGTYSYSQHTSGTCSSHQGVSSWL